MGFGNKMAEEKLNKIDQYLTARLFNHKVRRINGPLRNNTLMAELEGRYIGEERMKKATVQYQMLRSVNAARERVHKKWTRFCRNRKTWARVLRTDENRMHELMSRELITCKKDVEKLQITLRILGYLN